MSLEVRGEAVLVYFIITLLLIDDMMINGVLQGRERMHGGVLLWVRFPREQSQLTEDGNEDHGFYKWTWSIIDNIDW